MKNQNRRGDCLKTRGGRGLDSCQFEEVVFLRGGDTPVHTMLLLAENLLLPPPPRGKKPKNPRISLLPLNSIFMLQPNRNFIFSCSHCSCVIFFTFIHSVLNLIDVQYLQNFVFSFQMGSNGQNQAFSDSHLSWRKSFLFINFSEKKIYHWWTNLHKT